MSGAYGVPPGGPGLPGRRAPWRGTVLNAPRSAASSWSPRASVAAGMSAMLDLQR
jgi:hypothetical protein